MLGVFETGKPKLSAPSVPTLNEIAVHEGTVAAQVLGELLVFGGGRHLLHKYFSWLFLVLFRQLLYQVLVVLDAEELSPVQPELLGEDLGVLDGGTSYYEGAGTGLSAHIGQQLTMNRWLIVSEQVAHFLRARSGGDAVEEERERWVYVGERFFHFFYL